VVVLSLDFLSSFSFFRLRHTPHIISIDGTRKGTTTHVGPTVGNMTHERMNHGEHDWLLLATAAIVSSHLSPDLSISIYIM
jgi:hypothetical protein